MHSVCENGCNDNVTIKSVPHGQKNDRTDLQRNCNRAVHPLYDTVGLQFMGLFTKPWTGSKLVEVLNLLAG